MKTPRVPCGIIFLLILAVMTGCSDDDCPSCPTPDPLQSVMTGDIRLSEGILYLDGYIFDLDAPLPDVDSLLVGGEKATIKPVTDEGMWNYAVQYVSSGGDHDFSSGDPVPIGIFTPSGKCSASPKVLDKTADKPNVLDWSMGSPSDTVAIDSEIQISWNRVVNADWYEIRTLYQYRDQQGGWGDWEETVHQTDTVYTMPGIATAYDGYHQISIHAYAGPPADDPAGNISGGIMRGVINSHATRRFAIYVGSGMGWLNQSSESREEK